MAVGKVKWFKGSYGYITMDDNAQFFVHSTEIKNRRKLESGQWVTFDIVQSKKGLMATNVKILPNRLNQCLGKGKVAQLADHNTYSGAVDKCFPEGRGIIRGQGQRIFFSTKDFLDKDKDQPPVPGDRVKFNLVQRGNQFWAVNIEYRKKTR